MTGWYDQIVPYVAAGPRKPGRYGAPFQVASEIVRWRLMFENIDEPLADHDDGAGQAAGGSGRQNPTLSVEVPTGAVRTMSGME